MNTSDTTLSIIVIIIFLFLYIFNFIIIQMQHIKENWVMYRCQPLIIPFASFFGHDTSENFGFCIRNMQKSFMSDVMKPLYYSVDVANESTTSLTSSLNYTRKLVTGLRFNFMDMFKNIFATLYNIIVEIQRMMIIMKDSMGKLIGTMTTSMFLIHGSMLTMSSAWSGPPGGLVRALCFHPDTEVLLKNGKTYLMKDIPLNSILPNNARVISNMKISNLDENGNIIEKMYKLKRNKINIENNSHNDIIVSGSHLVYDLNTQKFIPTKHIKISELTNINCEILSCLITSNNTIQLGEWIFHDWEDNNGSPSKQI